MPDTSTLADRYARDLTHLLTRRPDLVGVHPPADALAATITWGA
jgi:hypothetical protein